MNHIGIHDIHHAIDHSAFLNHRQRDYLKDTFSLHGRTVGHMAEHEFRRDVIDKLKHHDDHREHLTKFELDRVKDSLEGLLHHGQEHGHEESHETEEAA